ncbi:MAG: type 11 methyltransferase [Sphingomonas bacterium]|nr:methyltransferase domain-containing protein [Sphingomonas bacterium]MDB5689494.1 type 11 methyltransferase [Sphingomonas bacterium]
MTPLAVRSGGPEQMDSADLDPATYAIVLRDLARVNRVTMSGRPTLSFLDRAVGTARHIRVLDVGYGQGDMLRRISRWAARRGIGAELIGIDLNANSAPAARAATPPEMRIDYRTGDYADLAGDGFDMILSSFVAHHMSEAELAAFLAFMEAESARGWLVNDLHRHRFAYAGYPLLARLMRWHPIVRQDGRLSIARSFRPGDWHALLARAGLADVARVVRRFPFRLCVERIR